jgi:hypothetical protein
MTEEQFNIELLSIKNDVENLLKTTNNISYKMLLRQLSTISYKDAESKVRDLFYFLIDSYDGDKSINDRLFFLFAPFRMPKKKKNNR